MMTPHQPPITDAVYYLSIAKHGISGNLELAAPYAYRPAVPLIAGALAALTGAEPEDAFLWITRVSAVLLLCIAYFFARSFEASFLDALAILCIVGFSLFHVKYPLYLPTMVDVEAVVMITIATWLMLKRRYVAGFVICSVGLFFKEFLLVPSLILVVLLLKDYRRDHSVRYLRFALLAAIAFALCFLLPRITFPVQAAFGSNLQFVLDAQHPWMYLQNLRMFLSGPLDLRRDVNILFVLASYWLPALVLVTPSRIRSIRDNLAGESLTLTLFMIFLLVLTMIGGTNIMIFVTYGVPVLVLVLSLLLRSASAAEVIFALAVTFVFNRIWLQIPLMSDNIGASMDVYGGWASRLNESTLYRTLEMIGYVFAAFVLRHLLRGSRPPEEKTAV